MKRIFTAVFVLLTMVASAFTAEVQYKTLLEEAGKELVFCNGCNVCDVCDKCVLSLITNSEQQIQEYCKYMEWFNWSSGILFIIAPPIKPCRNQAA